MRQPHHLRWPNIAIGMTIAVLLIATAAEAKPKGAKSRLKPGSAAPQFRLRALDGAMVRLDELAYSGREKGYAKKRPLLLDFFRTDCAPCIKAMPGLVDIHNKHHADGLDVLLVALLEEEDGRGKLERYLEKQKLPFTIAVDQSEHFAKKYLGDPVTLPASFLIDRTGVLKKTKYGAKGTYSDYFAGELEKVLADHKSSKKKDKK